MADYGRQREKQAALFWQELATPLELLQIREEREGALDVMCRPSKEAAGHLYAV